MKNIKNIKKRLAVIILALAMALTLVPANAFAAGSSVTITVHFCTLKAANGELTEVERTNSNSLSAGSSWTMKEAKFKNMANPTKFSVNGVTYEYTGAWTDGDGNAVSIPVTFRGSDYTQDTDVYFYAVYNKIMPTVLNFRYVDNVSTGSGSWMNTGGSFTSYTHTLKKPEDQDQ